MRRKRERNATMKAKASPERKQEKIKRTRSKRRKQSISSENESNNEIISGLVSEKVIDPDQSVEQSSKIEGSPDEPQDQIWQVKTPEGSGDGGEIQKLTICLTRPPLTPERAEKSLHSKKKFTHATSSSDSADVEVLDEKKKGKYRTKPLLCEASDNSENNNETQNKDEESDLQTESSIVNTVVEVETAIDKIELLNRSLESKCNKEKVEPNVETCCNEKLEPIPDTTNLNDENTESSDIKIDLNKEKSDSKNKKTESSDQVESEDKVQPESYKVTTTDKKKVDHTENDVASSELIITTSVMEDSITLNKLCHRESENKIVKEKHEESESLKIVSSERKRSLSVDKSEILEIHAEESKVDISSPGLMESEKEDIVGDNNVCAAITQEDQVSNIQETTMENVAENTEPPQNQIEISTNKTDVVANLEEAVKEYSIETCKSSSLDQKKVIDQSECTQMNKEENGQNGSMNIIINKKRRWGSRPNKLSSQKSITISTDVLKQIIPDVIKPVEFEEVFEEKKRYKRVEVTEKVERPILPKIVIDNTDNVEQIRDQEEQGSENLQVKEATNLATNRKISIVKDSDNIAVFSPPSPPRHKQSNILYITNLVRPFTLLQLKNLLQRTGTIVENGFWINRIKSKCFVIYEDEDQAVETRHALHGVTWPVSNPKTLHVDFSTQEEYEQAKVKEESEGTQNSTIPSTVEDWLREEELKREREVEKLWQRKKMREWDVGKNEKGVKLDKEKEKLRGDDRSMEKRRHHSPERSPEPAKKFKKKEEAPAKLLDDLFKKTKTTPCIYWLPLSAETIAVKEEQRRQHMAEYERRMLEFRRSHRRH